MGIKGPLDRFNGSLDTIFGLSEATGRRTDSLSE